MWWRGILILAPFQRKPPPGGGQALQKQSSPGIHAVRRRLRVVDVQWSLTVTCAWLRSHLQEVVLMRKSGAAPSPVVPGKYFVFLERLVQEHYQTLSVDAESEEQARDKALQLFFDGKAAYMNCTQVDLPTARVRPMREKHLRRSDASQDGEEDGPEFRSSGSFASAGADDDLVQPTGQFPGTRPAPVTRAQARLLCRNFDACGHSNHSGQGATLWVILEHCAAADIAYTLRAMPGMGYYVERAKNPDDGLGLRMPVETTYDGLA